MSVNDADDGIRRFLDDWELADARLAPVSTGRNNRVWVVEGRGGQYVLKQYRKSADGAQDRLTAEYRFLQFLQLNGISCVPSPIAHNDERELALYSFLPGRPPNEITEDHIVQSVGFLESVDRLRTKPAASEISFATDACLSTRDHLNGVRNRLVSFWSLETGSKICRQAKDFIEGQLFPTFSEIESRVLAGLGHRDPDERLIEQDRVLSPSDFGFHNSLEYEGVLHFLDFEYAGWDDPAKLVCDFVCQPDHPVQPELAELFVEQMCATLDIKGLVERIESLLLLHRLKWCCIILNEFLREERSEQFSEPTVRVELLRSQLDKAVSYFDRHLART